MRFNTHHIELWSFLLIRTAVRRLSIRTARRLGAVGGLISFYAFLRRRRYALGNLRQVYPQMSRHERKALARLTFRRIGASLLESAVWSTRDAPSDSDLFEVEGAEHLERLMSSGRGFIILGAHYGVWETGLMPYENALRPVTVIAKRTTNPLMQVHADAWRERRGFVQILSEGATLKIFRRLKRGDRVGFIADQRVRPEEGILLPFLGVPAWSSPMAAAMTIRTGAPVLPHFAEPLGKDRYRIRYLEPIEPDPAVGKGEDAVREMTRRINAVVERQILAQPELWFWVHERWVRIKRYRWESTRERWRKRSGLPQRSGPVRLPRSLVSVVRDYRRGAPLQAGECLMVTGDSGEHVSAGAVALGHAVIDAGRSFGWIEQGAAGRFVQKSDAEIDQFDVVAVVLSDGAEVTSATCREGESGSRVADGLWTRERIVRLVEHRVAMRRSVVLVEGGAGGGDAASELRLELVGILERSAGVRVIRT